MGSQSHISRRHLLSTTCTLALGHHATQTAAAHEKAAPNQQLYRIVLNSPSSVRVQYEFAVTGEVLKTIDADEVFSPGVVTKDPEDNIVTPAGFDGTVVRGVTQGGVDAYVYTGQIVAFDSTNCDAFNVWINGQQQSACRLNRNYNADVPPPEDPLSNHLVLFGGSADNILYYEFRVSGSLQPSEESGGAPIADRHVTFDETTPGYRDRIIGNIARGSLAGGGDAYRFSGDITSFEIDSGAQVYLNGEPRDPEQILGDGDVTIERITPEANEIAVVPGTDVLFHVLARNYAGERISNRVYVDGEEGYYGEPDRFYSQMDTSNSDVFTHRFETPGTHRVHVEVYDTDDNQLGTARWTVTVTDDGNRPPSVERVDPAPMVVTVPPNTGPTREFTIQATDPDGNLERVMWWTSQCDVLEGTSAVEGQRATATLSYDAYPGCPLSPFVVDEMGALTWFSGWLIREKGASWNYIRFESERETATTYEFTATEDITQLGLRPNPERDDTVEGTTASGEVGPGRDEDLFTFGGELTALSVDGPATVYLNGEQVDPDDFSGVSADEPTLSVETVTRIGESAYEVTFGYTNPNEDAIATNGQFAAGQSPDTPPSQLEPGQHTFTVTWQPNRDDERLRWEVSPAGDGDQESVSATTPPHATVREEWTLPLPDLRAKLDQFAPTDAGFTATSESSQTIQLSNNQAEATLTVRDDGTVSYEDETGWWGVAISRDDLLRPESTVEAQAQVEPESAAASNPAVQSVEQTGETYTVTIAVDNSNFGSQGIVFRLILRAVAPHLASYLISQLPDAGSYSDFTLSILRSIATALIRDFFTAEATSADLTTRTDTETSATTERRATETPTEPTTTTTETPTSTPTSAPTQEDTPTTTTTDTPTTTTPTETPPTTTTTEAVEQEQETTVEESRGLWAWIGGFI